MRKTYRDKIGDGKFPNQYWVSYSNDYEYLHDGNCVGWIGDLIPTFKSKGKTIAKPFKTYAAAKRFCDYEFSLGTEYAGVIVNRINIEDRLSGELYEKTRCLLPDSAEFMDEDREDTGFTEEKMAKNGYKFE